MVTRSWVLVGTMLVMGCGAPAAAQGFAFAPTADGPFDAGGDVLGAAAADGGAVLDGTGATSSGSSSSGSSSSSTRTSSSAGASSTSSSSSSSTSWSSSSSSSSSSAPLGFMIECGQRGAATSVLCGRSTNGEGGDPGASAVILAPCVATVSVSTCTATGCGAVPQQFTCDATSDPTCSGLCSLNTCTSIACDYAVAAQCDATHVPAATAAAVKGMLCNVTVDGGAPLYDAGAAVVLPP